MGFSEVKSTTVSLNTFLNPYSCARGEGGGGSRGRGGEGGG